MRCIWCGGSVGSLTEVKALAPNALGFGRHEITIVVHPEHEATTLVFLGKVQRNARYLTLGVVLLAVGGTLHPFLGPTTALGVRIDGVLAGGIVLGLGILMWSFPFATGLTVQAVGIRKSIAMARIGAAVLSLLGVLLVSVGVIL